MRDSLADPSGVDWLFVLADAPRRTADPGRRPRARAFAGALAEEIGRPADVRGMPDGKDVGWAMVRPMPALAGPFVFRLGGNRAILVLTVGRGPSVREMPAS
jgi:hypothetical protein